MSKRSLAPLAFGPIVLFLVAMALVSAFVTHPPILGWVGLGLLAVVLLAAAAAFFTAFSRMRTNAPRLHPHESDVHRLLVVTDADVDPIELTSAVRLRVLGRHAEVRVVAPVMPSSALHFLAEDEDTETGAARQRLRRTLRSLAEAGIHAQGVVGTDDPLQAAGDELASFRADEILFVAMLPSRRTWLDRDVELQARDRFGIPASTVFAKAPGQQPQTGATADNRAGARAR